MIMAQKKKRHDWRTGNEMDKRQKNGYIVPDTRLMFDFNMTLRKSGVESTRRCFTRADSIKEAESLVTAVAASIAKEDGWDSYEVAMAA